MTLTSIKNRKILIPERKHYNTGRLCYQATARFEDFKANTARESAHLTLTSKWYNYANIHACVF